MRYLGVQDLGHISELSNAVMMDAVKNCPQLPSNGVSAAAVMTVVSQYSSTNY